MTITIISVGTRSKSGIDQLIGDYTKRLPKHFSLTWVYVPHGLGDPETSKQHEAEATLRKVPLKSFVVLLDERGTQLSSPQLADKIFAQPHASIVFVIGGAYGVAQRVIDRADFTWSLGTLVFPHQLVRLLLAEQLYRAHTIHTGHPYHHE